MALVPGSTQRRAPVPLWLLLVAGGLLVAISGGVRATFGLYLDPVLESLDGKRSLYGLAIAIQSIVWGLGQPIAGAVADRFGSARVLAVGAAIYAAGLGLMGGANNALALHATAGFLAGAGMAAASMSVVLAAISRLAAPERRSRALGIATAMGTAGQIVLIPLAQWLIDNYNWRTTVVTMAVVLALMALSAPVFRGNAETQLADARAAFGSVGAETVEPMTPLRADLRKARFSRGYQLLNLAFFVCGFHVTFIATHLKSYAVDLGQSGSIAAWALVLIGVFNMAGSYAAGVLGDRHSKTHLLALIYGLRAVVIAVFLLVPISGASILVFGAGIGLLWLTTVPLTSGIIAAQFGTANAGALFGIVFFTHQVGAFIGAWMGGWLADSTGSYNLAWWLAIGLAIFAAAVHLVLDDGPAPEPPPPGSTSSRAWIATTGGFLVLASAFVLSVNDSVEAGAPTSLASNAGSGVADGGDGGGEGAGSGERSLSDIAMFCLLHPNSVDRGSG